MAQDHRASPSNPLTETEIRTGEDTRRSVLGRSVAPSSTWHTLHAHTTHTAHTAQGQEETAERCTMSVIAALPRMDSFGGVPLPRLDSLTDGGSEDVDLSIDYLLEGYPDLSEEWDLGAVMFAGPHQTHAAEKTFAPWEPADEPQPDRSISKKRRMPTKTVTSMQKEQVMQMPGTWFDMPEFSGTMQNFMSDDMMFDAINEAVANRSLATETVRVNETGWISTPVDNDPPPPYSASNLDTHIINYLKNGKFRNVRLNARSERAATKVEEIISSTPVCEESSTPQKVTRGPYQYTFGTDPDPRAAAKKLAIRHAALARYRQKKIDRANRPAIRYTSRKKIADSRPRVKGRFIKTDSTVRAGAKAQ